jgi:hypothetical protein
MDAASFRNFVLEVLSEAFPDQPFVPGERADAIRWKDSEIGLHNLHADAALLQTEPEKVRQTIVEHFARIVQLTDVELAILPQTWEEARSRVRLQLMPAAFARAGVSVTYPFLDEVLISVVVDAEHGYAYVRTEDVERWQVSQIDLYESACDNLRDASQNLGVSFYQGPPSIIALDINDGYAAARILLPSLREFVSQRLGSPFFAGIPNRDFLIMWSAGDEAFQARMKAQLVEDTLSRSHPLSNQILVATEESISPLI